MWLPDPRAAYDSLVLVLFIELGGHRSNTQKFDGRSYA